MSDGVDEESPSRSSNNDDKQQQQHATAAAATSPTTRNRLELKRSSSSILPVSTMALMRKSRTSSTLLLASERQNSVSEGGRGDEEQHNEEDEDDDSHCMDYGKPPPIEEPHCYYTCESSVSDEGQQCAVQISRDYLKTLLVEHARGLGCRLQLLDDLEAGKCDDLEQADKFLDGCKPPHELDALLLYASFLGLGELLPRIHARGADLNHQEPELGVTALHLCAFSNCLSGVQYLLNHVINLNAKKPHTPFHFAGFGNAADVARHFQQLYWSQESPIPGEETVLHSAARNGAHDVLGILAPKNAWINRLDNCGWAPIHYVVDRADSEGLEILLAAGGCLVDVSTRKGETPLHLAAKCGCADTLGLLLKKGANASLRNHRGETALHLASRTHSLECVEALLQHSSAEIDAEDSEGKTALHVTMGRSPLTYDVAETLITWKAQVNRADKYGYTPLHLAAINELSECVDILIQHGADLSAKTKGGTTALSIILRKTPSSLNWFKQRLDASISLHQHGSASGEVELRLDFHPLLQSQQRGEIGYLGIFVKEGYKEILEHPLCQSFLYLKWQKIRKYYVGRLLFYLLYVLVLTTWVITALAHNCYNESHGQLDNSSRPLCANSTGVNGFLYKHPLVLDFEWWILVSLTVLEALRKLLGILTYSSIRQFFTQAENMVEWCVILSVFATSFVFAGRTHTWQSHVGAFAVLCGWTNLMLMIGQLPMFGAYVAMFTSVQAQVFKLLLAYACLLVGFTASFCVIFPRSKSFSSPHTGLIKVLVMMTGELDFEDLFFPEEMEGVRPVDVGGTSWILLQVSAQLSFVLFLLFVTIVLMNLLVGIAVHDIKGLQKTAGLAKLVRQTKLICDLETALHVGMPQCLRKMLHWTAVVMPKRPKAVLTVRPLNPREKRLPRDVLASAYKVGRERKTSSQLTTGAKQSNNTANSIVGYGWKYDINSSMRRYGGRQQQQHLEQESAVFEVAAKLKEEVMELKKMCESNNKLIHELVRSLSSTK
ncbi:hypothetical protein TKK_0012777 [Trichogramma kaykai]|uniref:Ion transport domain-containing protein n=1 Tax=Trichogramma kaykai TaxID=54128 RepID=A0ABD2WLD0_9HYME